MNASSSADDSTNSKCIKCGAVVSSNAKFCLQCGASQMKAAPALIKCIACGGKTPEFAKFCKECGALQATPQTNSPEPVGEVLHEPKQPNDE